MRNVFILVMTATVMLFAFMGCQRGAQFDGPTVGLVLKTLNNPFFNDMEDGAIEVANELEINLLVQGAQRETDVEAQMQIIENLIQMNVDLLAITPSGSAEILPAVAKANAAGIPVMIIDTRLDEDRARAEGVQFETFIGSDNYEGGRVAAQYVIEQTGGEANVAILEGIPGHETADSRLRGFMDGIQDVGGVQVITSQPANWERDQGYNVFQNMMQAHPQIDVVFACNDMMALGAVEAIQASRREGEILVVGFDATTDARHAISEGRMGASVAQFPEEMGREAVRQAARILNGEEVSSEIPVQIELITRENVAMVAE